MANKVWVVLAGCTYEGAHLEDIFDTKEKAKEYAENIPWPSVEDATISEDEGSGEVLYAVGYDYVLVKEWEVK